MAVLQRVLRAVAPGFLLAGLMAVPGVLPSAAADLTWAPYGTLAGGFASFGIAQDPGTPAVTWAATSGAGLQRTDDGKSWHQVGTGVLPSQLWKVVIDPSKGPLGPSPMYVGSAGQGLYKSLDGGKTWTGSTLGLASSGSRNIRGIAMGVNQLMVATSDGVFKSGDGGRTWQAAGLQGMDISALAYARYAAPPTIVASIDGVNNPGSRVVVTSNGGASWAPVKQGVPSDIVVSGIAATAVRTDANLRSVFLVGSAGVFKSDDQGQTWGQVSGLPAQGFGAVATSPSDSSIVYVGSDGGGTGNGGVWRTSDRGGSWTQLTNGLAEKGVTSISVGRDNPSTVVATAWNPDKPLSVAYSLQDSQAPPSGQAEGGVCPEPSCQGGVHQEPAGPTPSPSVAPSPSPCYPSPAATPSHRPQVSPGTSPEASPSAEAASPSPAGSPSPVPCVSPHSELPGPAKADIPVPVAVGAVVVLAALLVGSIVVTRVRG